MALKGGYTILDLRDNGFTAGEAQTITGLHERFERSYRKPYLLSGIVLGGVEYIARWVVLDDVSGTYTGKVSIAGDDYTMTVTADDAVTFTKIEV